MHKNTVIKALLALFVLTLIWGYNWVVMKVAVQYASPFQFAAMRTVFGALVLFGLIALTKRPLALSHFPTMLALGLLQTVGFTGLLIWALVEGGAGKTAVLLTLCRFGYCCLLGLCWVKRCKAGNGWRSCLHSWACCLFLIRCTSRPMALACF
jgi:drug/metabolite transporter (DMT)-like permease